MTSFILCPFSAYLVRLRNARIPRKYILRALIKPMQFQTNRCLRSTELHQTNLRRWRRAGKYFEGRAIKFVEQKANKQKARQDKRRNRNHQNTQTLKLQGKKVRWRISYAEKGSQTWRVQVERSEVERTTSADLSRQYCPET